MNVLAEANRLCTAAGLHFEADLATYVRAGFVYKEPGRLLLWRPIRLAEP